MSPAGQPGQRSPRRRQLFPLGRTLGHDDRLAAFSRADIPAQERRDFFVYVDEFQNFTTLAVTNMLSELRKYRVSFTIGHQYLHQLEPECAACSVG
jgi:hypothetical protein